MAPDSLSQPESPAARASRRVDAKALLEVLNLPDLYLARRWLCAQLAASGARDEVVAAFGAVPRHAFVAGARWRVAYLDLDLRTRQGWLKAPGTIARVLSSLPIGACRILEIGTGPGYQTALLAALGGTVTSAEPRVANIPAARARLDALGCADVRLHPGDWLSRGAKQGRFDAIVINSGLRSLPKALPRLLESGGGVVVAPLVSADGRQRLIRYEFSPGRGPASLDLGPCRFDVANVDDVAAGGRHGCATV